MFGGREAPQWGDGRGGGRTVNGSLGMVPSRGMIKVGLIQGRSGIRAAQAPNNCITLQNDTGLRNPALIPPPLALKFDLPEYCTLDMIQVQIPRRVSSQMEFCFFISFRIKATSMGAAQNDVLLIAINCVGLSLQRLRTCTVTMAMNLQMLA